jgi:hypothetical protein
MGLSRIQSNWLMCLERKKQKKKENKQRKEGHAKTEQRCAE